MFFKRTLMPILFGILMIGATSAANAQVAEMSKGMALYQSAAQELVALYNGTKDAASAKAMAQKIDAAQKRKDTAEAAIQAALQKLDPKNENAGKLAEKIFGEMQAEPGRCRSTACIQRTAGRSECRSGDAEEIRNPEIPNNQ